MRAPTGCSTGRHPSSGARSRPTAAQCREEVKAGKEGKEGKVYSLVGGEKFVRRAASQFYQRRAGEWPKHSPHSPLSPTLHPHSRSPADSYSRQRAIAVILISLALCYIVRVVGDAADADSASCCANWEGVGSPRKYMPRKKIPADLRSLARGHTELCIKVLAGMLSHEAVPAAARVSAAGILLDRGWGKPPQAHTGEDGGGIRVTVRQIVERRDED